MDKRQQDLNIPLNISDLIRAVVMIDQSLISSFVVKTQILLAFSNYT